jgi:cysteinyl-tRNA synthetase
MCIRDSHHTDEIAQSESAFGHKWVNYWLHNEFLNLKNWKMSKSLGNVITLDDIIEKWFDPLAFKYFIYTSHYRSIQDFSWEDLQAAQKAYEKLKSRIIKLLQNNKLEELNLEDIKNIYENKFYGREIIDYLLDDIDTVKVIAYINKEISKLSKKEKLSEDDLRLLSLIKYIDDNILKLDLFKKQEQEEIPEDVKILAEQRWQAKLNKDFETADKLRNEILEKWYKLLDSKDSYEIKKI